jgi:hypothetical protein
MLGPAVANLDGGESRKYRPERNPYFISMCPAQSPNQHTPAFLGCAFSVRALEIGFHFWPFDSWKVPPGKSAVVEVYPALWSHSFPRDGRDSHQQDAYAVAEWLRRNDLGGSLERSFTPSLTEDERNVAEIEGWILGIA